MFENNPNAVIWKYSMLTQNGAITMAKTLQKMGSTIQEQPTFDKENNVWVITFTNPLLSK